MFTQMNCKMSRVGPIVDDDVEESFIDCLLVMREWMDGWMDGWWLVTSSEDNVSRDKKSRSDVN